MYRQYYYVNCIWVNRYLRQHGQENKGIVILQLSVSNATMEEEVVDVNVRLNYVEPETAIFQKIIRHSFEFPEV